MAQEERSAQVTDWGVCIQSNCAPCACRCRHCCLDSGVPAGVSYERAQRVAQRFLDWKERAGRTDLRVDFGVGFSCEMPGSHVLDYAAFRRDHQMDG